MSTELSPEQIAEIRADLAEHDVETTFVDAVMVLALCDTADALREQLDKTANEPADRMTRRDSYQWGLAKGRNEAREELETLRGIVKRVSDNWMFPLPGQKLDPARRRWWRIQDGAINWTGIQEEPMSEAEVQAIYGQKETSDE